MVDDKTEPPEIDHGPNVDKGIERHVVAPKPCSKRMQGQHGIYWCTKDDGHKDECEGSPPSEPIRTSNIVRIDHRYDGGKKRT